MQVGFCLQAPDRSLRSDTQMEPHAAVDTTGDPPFPAAETPAEDGAGPSTAPAAAQEDGAAMDVDEAGEGQQKPDDAPAVRFR